MRLMRGEPGNWTGRGHFFGAAAEAMRRILIERARRKAQIKRGAGAERVDISQVDLIATESDGSLLEVNDSLDRLEKQDPDKARVVMLKFFAGLTNQEVAESLGVTERTVERQWAFAKSWLTVDMREARR